MMRLILASLLLLSACSGTAPATVPSTVTLYVTPAAQAWLDEAFLCAERTGAVIERVPGPDQAELVLRLGEPAVLTTLAYQIDSEEIWVIASRRSSLSDLTLEEVRRLFAGHGDPSIQVWAYASAEDVQRVFDQVVMSGRGVNPSARLAADPEHMLEEVSRQPDSVGILPRRWASASVRALYILPQVPVLALTESEPQGTLRELIACLQSRRAV